MFKKLLFVAAFAMASSPAFVSAQDFFFSFDEFSRQPTLTQASPAAGGPATGQLFIFSDAALDFDQIDLDFTVDNPGVASFTNGVAADSDGSFTVITVEDPNVSGGPLGPTDGRIFGFAYVFLFQLDLFDYGQLPFDTSDAEFRAGANGFLLATVDYSVAGVGQANFDFILGDLGVANSRGGGGPPIILDPDFAGSTATLTVVGVPEPSSAVVLLMLGAAGSLARRSRS